MSLLTFTANRNIKATNARGDPCEICLVSIVHENGVGQTIAIPEERIQLEGDGLIEREVRKAVASPSAASFTFKTPRFKPQ